MEEEEGGGWWVAYDQKGPRPGGMMGQFDNGAQMTGVGSWRVGGSGWKWAMTLTGRSPRLMPDLVRKTPVDSALVACDPSARVPFRREPYKEGLRGGPEVAHPAAL